MCWVPAACQVISYTQQTYVASSLGPIIRKRKLNLKLRDITFLLLLEKKKEGGSGGGGGAQISASDTALFQYISSSL